MPRHYTLEELEKMLVVVAYVVATHGPAYAGLLARLEREVEAARANNPVERAHKILEKYAAAGTGTAPLRLLAPRK
jgi:hypothetical protein